MTYIRKELRSLIEQMDYQFKEPDEFIRFKEEHKIKENLILKKANKGYCTYCGGEFECNKKIGKFQKCKSCGNTYLVRSSLLKNYKTRQDLILLDKISNYYVARVFELMSVYDYTTKKFKYYCTEWKRVVFNKERQDILESNIVSRNTSGYLTVYHQLPHEMFKLKRNYNYYYSQCKVVGDVCPYNLKKLLKDTNLKYSMLWEYLKHNKTVEVISLINHYAEYPSFELLNKMKLWNLASECYHFDTKGSFKQRFGVDKKWYPFMQRHNITYEQLKVLQIVPTTNIRMIRDLAHIYNLDRFSKFVDIETAYNKYLLKDPHLYYDYLVACKKLQYDMKSKKVLYPDYKRLNKLHDEVVGLVEVAQNELHDKLIRKRAEELAPLTYQNNKYKVFAMTSLDFIIDEASQMKNCVFKNYSENYALGDCNLFVVRGVENVDKALITVETDSDTTRIIQARQACNKPITEEQQSFLDSWLKHISSKVVNANA